MDRRAFITGLGAVLAAPLAAEGAAHRQLQRIGFVEIKSARTVRARAPAPARAALGGRARAR